MPNIRAINLECLLEMLTYCRPHMSPHELAWLKRFVVPLGFASDRFGNYYKVVGEGPRILWASHSDTVHVASGYQEVAIKDGMISLARRGRCLGADNGAGVFLLTEMIKAGVPGLYCVFRDEENAQAGSRWFADNMQSAYADLQAAIAFDRRGTSSIITHQRGQRCCSDAFAERLSSLLNLGHVADSTGGRTDTASFMGRIPECTNISVGFMNEHSSDETLDVAYLSKLRSAVLKADWTAMFS